MIIWKFDLIETYDGSGQNAVAVTHHILFQIGVEMRQMQPLSQELLDLRPGP